MERQKCFAIQVHSKISIWYTFWDLLPRLRYLLVQFFDSGCMGKRKNLTKKGNKQLHQSMTWFKIWNRCLIPWLGLFWDLNNMTYWKHSEILIHLIVQVCDVSDEFSSACPIPCRGLFWELTTRCRTMGAIAPSSHKRASTGMSKTSQYLLVKFAFNAASWIFNYSTKS